MLKPSAALLESDARFRDLVYQDASTGKVRPMCIDDLRSMVASIEPINMFRPRYGTNST